MHNMYSIILAAGHGTRMIPLSYYIPKLLLPVRGKPVLNYLLENLKGLPIDTHYIVASKHINTINTYLEKTELKNIKTIQALAWETGGDLAIALEEISRDDDVVIMNGDLMTDISIVDLYKFHKEKGADVTIALMPISDESVAKRLGIVELNEDGKILNFTEKPTYIKKMPATASVGIYIFDKKFIQKWRDYMVPKKVRLEMELFPRLVKEGKIYGYVGNPKYFWDVGTHESYLHAENFMSSREGFIPPK